MPWASKEVMGKCQDGKRWDFEKGCRKQQRWDVGVAQPKLGFI